MGWKIEIDSKPFEIDEQFISGEQLKALVNVPRDFGLWCHNGYSSVGDIEVSDSCVVDLKMPNRNRFFTSSKNINQG